MCVCVLAYMESALCLITYPEHGQRSHVNTRGVWRWRSRRRRSFSQDKQRRDAAEASTVQITWTNNYIFLVCAFIRPGTNALTIAFPLSVTGAKFQQSCTATTTTTRAIIATTTAVKQLSFSFSSWVSSFRAVVGSVRCLLLNLPLLSWQHFRQRLERLSTNYTYTKHIYIYILYLYIGSICLAIACNQSVTDWTQWRRYRAINWISYVYKHYGHRVPSMWQV